MPKRILIVDDSAPVRNTVKFMLESVPDWVVGGEARNGREAIDKAALLNPHLVLLDLSMPVMNGLDAARELSRMRPDLPIVFNPGAVAINNKGQIAGTYGTSTPDVRVPEKLRRHNLVVHHCGKLEPTGECVKQMGHHRGQLL